MSTGQEKVACNEAEEKMIGDIKNMLAKHGLIGDLDISNKKLREKIRLKRKIQYRNIQQLLDQYRDMKWAVSQRINYSILTQTGETVDISKQNIDEILTAIRDMGEEISSGFVKDIVSAVDSELLLERLEDSVERLKSKPKVGEIYYEIIHYSYIDSPVPEMQVILEKLGISRATFFRYRAAAVEQLAVLIWGAPTRNLQAMVDLVSILSDGQY